MRPNVTATRPRQWGLGGDRVRQWYTGWRGARDEVADAPNWALSGWLGATVGNGELGLIGTVVGQSSKIEAQPSTIQGGGLLARWLDGGTRDTTK
jgi:hypothetical protein